MNKINFKKIAKEVIETEIRSLKKLKANINQSFNKAVEAILACKNGKVVISGVGKSGIIGKKISSTLSSVGVPSFFVDASACSHGDLGQISSNDVLILVSFRYGFYRMKLLFVSTKPRLLFEFHSTTSYITDIGVIVCVCMNMLYQVLFLGKLFIT